MQGPQNIYFSPDPTHPYKIVSALDAHKTFTIQEQTHKLVITDYTGAPNQLFKIFQNNLKYAFVNPALDSALHVQGQNLNDGGVVKTDIGQHKSSFFEIVPATQGQWAGKACLIKTFVEGKTLDIKGGKANPNTEICQWKSHGGVNQQWLIIPADVPQVKVEMTQGIQQPVHQEVPAVFQPKPKTHYKIVSVLDEHKCLTVNNEGKLIIHTFESKPNQKFSFPWENKKFALVVAKNETGLCIFQDKQDNGVQIISDAGQHTSSWFEIVRNDKGNWAHKAYLIKTHAGNKAFDIAGGKAQEGKNVLQYNIHNGDNQLWLIQPFQDEKPKKDNKKAGKDHKEPEVADVAPIFQADPKHLYKISSILNENIVLTVNKEGKLIVDKHHNNKDQHFHLYNENNKFALVDQKSNAGLCIFQDKQDNAAEIISDAGKHVSSWFEIVRVQKGPFAHKGYLIKTHAGNRALDIAGGKAEEGKHVLQYNIHQGGNQVWHIEPLNQGKKVGQNQGQGVPQGNTNWIHKLQNLTHLFPQAQQGNNQGMGFAQNAHFKPNQNYIFYAVHGNGIKALDIAQDQANFCHLIMYSFHGAPNQRFVFEAEGNMFRIKNVKEGKYLNVLKDSPKSGEHIRCDDKGTAQSQLWTIIPASDPKYAGKGAFHIRSIFGFALETPAGSLDNSVRIQQGKFNCTDGQTWIIKEI